VDLAIAGFLDPQTPEAVRRAQRRTVERYAPDRVEELEPDWDKAAARG
jgi:hypothetical protein